MSSALSDDQPPFDRVVIGVLSVGLVLLHVAVNLLTVYEFHRDEFLYLAMGEHLRLFRMDFPPAIALIANSSRAIFGDSLTGIRVLPAVAHGVIALLSALTARELGGRAAAQRIAFLAVALSPLFLRAGSMLQPVVFDQLWWTLALWSLLRLASSDDGRWWIAIGASLGFGLLTKFSIAFIGVPMVTAIVLTPQRRWLATRWPWIALLLALAIGSPSIIGQIALGFPVRGQMDSLQASQLARVTYSAFLGEQLLFGPGALLAILGVASIWLVEQFRPYRVVALSCVGAFLLLLVLHGKAYYIGPIYPVLYGVGAAAIERLQHATWRRRLFAAAAVVVVAFGAVILPLGVPILAPTQMIAYTKRLGIAKATETNRGEQIELPQDYADMLGWREMAEAVAAIVDTMPESEREVMVIVGDNYGEAGALEFYGKRYRLPPVICTKGSFWFFGHANRSGQIVITVGEKRESLQRIFADVQELGFLDTPWVVPEERHVPILIGRRPSISLQELWPTLAGRN